MNTLYIFKFKYLNVECLYYALFDKISMQSDSVTLLQVFQNGAKTIVFAVVK